MVIYTHICIHIYIYIVIFEGCKTIHFEEHMKMGTIESRLLRRPKIIILRYLQRARVIDTAIDACNRQIRQRRPKIIILRYLQRAHVIDTAIEA